MSVLLRRLRWWDVEAVVPLERELFDDPWTAEMFWSELAQVDSRYFVVAAEGEQVLGYAGLAAFPDGGYVQTIGVTPVAQRRGLGLALLLDLLHEARRRGCESVALEVRVDNQAAQALYRRCGFAPVGLRRAYYQPSGTDALVMIVDEVGGLAYAERLAALERVALEVAR